MRTWKKMETEENSKHHCLASPTDTFGARNVEVKSGVEDEERENLPLVFYMQLQT